MEEGLLSKLPTPVLISIAALIVQAAGLAVVGKFRYGWLAVLVAMASMGLEITSYVLFFIGFKALDIPDGLEDSGGTCERCDLHDFASSVVSAKGANGLLIAAVALITLGELILWMSYVWVVTKGRGTKGRTSYTLLGIVLKVLSAITYLIALVMFIRNKLDDKGDSVVSLKQFCTEILEAGRPISVSGTGAFVITILVLMGSSAIAFSVSELADDGDNDDIMTVGICIWVVTSLVTLGFGGYVIWQTAKLKSSSEEYAYAKLAGLITPNALLGNLLIIAAVIDSLELATALVGAAIRD